MNDDTPVRRMRYPEQPVNLPRNAAPAEYGSDAIAELITQIGFGHVFLVPGSSYRGLHDSLVNHTRNHRPEIVLATREDIAVSMAHGYAKATGKPALCILHDLVGLMAGCMGVYNAWADRAPVVILSGSGPADPARRRVIDWVHTANTQANLVKPFVKWADEPPTLQATLDSLAKGLKIACSAPSGPVYLSIDQIVQEERTPEDLVIPDVSLPRYRKAPPTAADPDALAEAADMLLSARLPLVVGGRLGLDAAVTAPIAALVELTGAAYADDRNICCLPTAHPQSLTGDPGIRSEADVVFAVDCVDTTNAVDGHGVVRGRPGQQIIEMGFDGGTPSAWSNLGGPLPAIALQIVCDPLLGLRQLTAAVERRLAGDAARLAAIEARRRSLAERHEALRAAQSAAAKALSTAVPIHPTYLTQALWDVVRGKKWSLVMRNHRSFPEGVWELPGAGAYLGGDGGGGIGYGPGASIGAALALREAGRLPIAILGDGDFVMAAGALWTAAHYRIPLLMVINNNTSWGNDEHHQINVAGKRGRPVENAWIGQRMVDPDIDFATVARGYGAWAEGPVTDPARLAETFRRAVAEVEGGKVAVVDVRTAL